VFEDERPCEGMGKDYSDPFDTDSAQSSSCGEGATVMGQPGTMAMGLVSSNSEVSVSDSVLEAVERQRAVIERDAKEEVVGDKNFAIDEQEDEIVDDADAADADVDEEEANSNTSETEARSDGEDDKSEEEVAIEDSPELDLFEEELAGLDDSESESESEADETDEAESESVEVA